MTREIKFRLWMNDQMNYPGDRPFLISPWGIPIYNETKLDAVVMQYTGIRDRNGKEIYEGDVLKTDLSRTFLVVVYRNGAFMFQCHDNGKDYFDLMVPIEPETDRIDNLEVIGNIYETSGMIHNA